MAESVNEVVEDINAAITPDQKWQDAHERKVAARLIIGVVVALAAVGVATAIWGLPALTIAGLIATLFLMVVFVFYLAGF